MNIKKIAMVFGMGGQDSFYLSELLLSKKYTVVGVTRRSSQPRAYLIPLVEKGVIMEEGDVTDISSIEQLIKKYQPIHVYNLAAQSHVGTSFSQPSYTSDVVANGVLNILEVIRHHSPSTKLYQASSSEMFGKSVSERATHLVSPEKCTCLGLCKCPRKVEKFQDENTIFTPQSPYAVAKLYAHHMVRLYRESYGLFACSGILFNHESERRGENFVTRKITRYVGQLVVWLDKQKESIDNLRNLLAGNVSGGTMDIVWGPDLLFEKTDINITEDETPLICHWIRHPKLKLGNIYSYRDWSHAEDLVKAMVLMLEADKPNDYVVGSGETHTVEEFLVEAFGQVGLDWKDWVEIDQSLIRPAEVDYLCSNPEKVKRELGWKPEIDFKNLVKRMVDYDIDRARLKARLYGI